MNCVTAGNVMVQLFLQTQPKFHLNNKKLQYLLCIAQFASLRCGEKLFDDNIRNLKNGFAIEKIADSFVSRSAIQEGGSADKALKRTCKDFKLPYSSKKIYSFNEEISEENKQLLTSVFINFGSYKEESLCRLLNGLTPLRKLPVWELISNDFVIDFFKNTTEANNEEYDNNEIFCFCDDYFSQFQNQLTSAQNHKIVDSRPQEEDVVADVVPEIVKPVKKDVLEKYLSACEKNCVVGKKYAIYVETDFDKPVKDVIIVNLSDNNRVCGKLKKINNTTYCYSFIGIPANIKISIDF